MEAAGGTSKDNLEVFITSNIRPLVINSDKVKPLAQGPEALKK